MDLKFHKILVLEEDQHAIPYLWSKTLDMSSVTVWLAPNLLKALAILSNTTVRRSTVGWEASVDLKSYWKSENRPHCLRLLASLLLTNISKTFLTQKED